MFHSVALFLGKIFELNMDTTLLKRFGTVAILEGISYLLLLFIAMPLKYWAGIPEGVKYVGWGHGLLFILYVVFLLWCWQTYRWSFKQVILFFVASLLPFAPFWVEKRIKDKPYN